MKNLSRILWGLVLIAVGVIIAINSLGIARIEIFFDGWWTLFIIVPCLIGLFNERSKTGNIIGLIIGIILLLVARGIISWSLIGKLIVPIILVGIGIYLVFNDILKKNVNEKIKTINNNNLEYITATFSEQRVTRDDEFNGGNLDAVFGSIILNIKDATLSKETLIKTSSIFGGITIIVPKDVNVVIKSTPIFGGVDNKIINNKNNKNTIYIDAFCLFGGVDIK